MDELSATIHGLEKIRARLNQAVGELPTECMSGALLAFMTNANEELGQALVNLRVHQAKLRLHREDERPEGLVGSAI